MDPGSTFTSRVTLAPTQPSSFDDPEPVTAPSVTFPVMPARLVDETIPDISTLNVVVPPLLFGRYRRVRELGRGGMGVVSLADDQTLGIQVALKHVPEEVARSSA